MNRKETTAVSHAFIVIHQRRLAKLTLEHDNARPHSARNTKDFIERWNIQRVFQASNGPHTNLCDRWLFAKLEQAIRGNVFNSADEVELFALDFFRLLLENKYVHQLCKLFEYCQTVVDHQGDFVLNLRFCCFFPVCVNSLHLLWVVKYKNVHLC